MLFFRGDPLYDACTHCASMRACMHACMHARTMALHACAYTRAATGCQGTVMLPASQQSQRIRTNAHLDICLPQLVQAAVANTFLSAPSLC